MRKIILICFLVFFAVSVNAADSYLGGVGISASVFSIPQTEDHYAVFNFFNPVIFNLNGTLYAPSLGIFMEWGVLSWDNEIISGRLCMELLIDEDCIVPMSHMYYIHPAGGVSLGLQFFRLPFFLGFGVGYGVYFDIGGIYFPGYCIKGSITSDIKNSHLQYGFSFEYNEDSRMRYRLFTMYTF
jgi:hypothetical protein